MWAVGLTWTHHRTVVYMCEVSPRMVRRVVYQLRGDFADTVVRIL